MCQHHIFILHDKRCQKCIFPSCLRLAKVVELNFNFFKSIIYKFSKIVMDTQMINNFITTKSFWFFFIAQILLLQVFLRKISCSLITLLKNIQSDQTIVPTPIRGEEMMIIGLTISHKSKMNRNFTLKKVKKMYQTLYVIVLTFAKVSRGLRSVNLFLLRLLTCSTTREKWDMALRPSLACNESSTSWEDKLENNS